MFRGGFESAPYPLGGDGGVEGITAEQHSRICADVVAAWRTLPIAIVGVDMPGATASFFLSRFGTGTSNTNAPTISTDGTSHTITFPQQIEDEMGVPQSLKITHAVAVALSTAGTRCPVSVISNSAVSVKTWVTGGTTTDTRDFVIEIYGSWGDDRTIDSYGGSLTKKNDVKEHPAPYAAQIYRDLQNQRGSAYTTKPGTFVHVENMAIARQVASVCYRLPEKLQNNASGPRKADEGLDYWAACLGLQKRPTETVGAFRERAALHRRLSKGGTYDNLRDEVSTLLGPAFISIEFNHDGEFETPSTNTYWPVINPGPDSYDLGGGTWLSDRSQVIINAERPGGMSEPDFSQLMNSDLFELVDRMIPAWATAQWRDADSVRTVWDGAGVLWDGGATWDQLFDWNS